METDELNILAIFNVSCGVPVAQVDLFYLSLLNLVYGALNGGALRLKPVGGARLIDGRETFLIRSL